MTPERLAEIRQLTERTGPASWQLAIADLLEHIDSISGIVTPPASTDPEECRRLAEIEGRLSRAAEGPWSVDCQENHSHPENGPLLLEIDGADGYFIADLNRVARKPGEYPGCGALDPRDNAALIANAPQDLRRLLDTIDQRDRILHDMALDGMEQAIYERSRIVRWLRERASTRRHMEGSFYLESALENSADQLEAEGVAEPLPADQLRARVEELEQALREIASSRFTDRTNPEGLDWLREIAQKALAVADLHQFQWSPPPAGALAARLAECLVALEPFARWGGQISEETPDVCPLAVSPEAHYPARETAGVGDLRRARDILERHRQQEQSSR